ncbi:uncharacterized protein [Bemisia tabaci]|nr:PREDICTED: splicing factor, arginine/serine-rich 19-like [Bemisia tabaci]XP_018899395.1 PREDICTED: splicing factor, arginine/serine-rich 19-like [Bemisia tabaci]
MRIHLICLIAVAVLTKGLDGRQKRQSSAFFQGPPQQFRGAPTPKPQGFLGGPVPRYANLGSTAPQGFRAAPPVDEESEEEVERNSITPSPSPYRQSPIPQAFQSRPPPPPQAQPQILLRPQRPQQIADEYQPRRPQGPNGQRNPQSLAEDELEEEKEEPDRLTQLLPQSKFNCAGKKTGYYADEGLNCEVFHYCQDSARHSWICPEGFLFHQVHLICMPPSHDNICKQSSQYHFVNEYLYRPINVEEAQTKPNVSLRYADRYYPENYYEGEEEESVEARPQPQTLAAPRRQPPQQVPQGLQGYNAPLLRPVAVTPVPQQYSRQPLQFNPSTPALQNQVFHSPEEVNIPLLHRRPNNVIPQSQRSFPQGPNPYVFQ